jgi:hypothetical protein
MVVFHSYGNLNPIEPVADPTLIKPLHFGLCAGLRGSDAWRARRQVNLEMSSNTGEMVRYSLLLPSKNISPSNILIFQKNVFSHQTNMVIFPSKTSISISKNSDLTMKNIEKWWA